MGGLGLVWGLMARLGGGMRAMRVVCLSGGWLWTWKPPDDPGTHYPQAMQLLTIINWMGMGNIGLICNITFQLKMQTLLDFYALFIEETMVVFLIINVKLTVDFIQSAVFTLKIDHRSTAKTKRHAFTCAKHKLYMFKYLAKFSLIIHKTHLYQRSRYSSKLRIKNKALYLEIKAGWLQYLEGFTTSFLLCEKKIELVISDYFRLPTS